MTLQRVCVFAGSGPGAREAYAAAARELGTLLATRRIGLVYGGARTGLMGELADAALAAGGEVIGVIPEFLVGAERAHRGLSELLVVDSMHTRKARMAQLADAVVALPGGTGTLEELIEALTWVRLGLQQAPLGLLDVDRYWEPLLAFLQHAVREQFVAPADLALLSVEADAAGLVDLLGARAAGSPARVA